MSAHAAADRWRQRHGIALDPRSIAYADFWLRRPTWDLPLPDLRHWFRESRGLVLPMSLVDLAVTGAQDLSFSNVNTGFDTANANTTGCTWLCLMAHAYIDHVTAGTITVCTYNGVSIMANYHSNAAHAPRAAGVVALLPFALGANAGNHLFHVEWSDPNFIDLQVIFGTGDIDAAVIDATGWQEGIETRAGSISTPAAYTPTADKALPIFGYATDGLNGTITAATNCSLHKISAIDSGVGIFSCPLSTPAGTPTAATINNSNAGSNLAVQVALKPSGGGGGGTNWGPSLLATSWNRLVQT